MRSARFSARTSVALVLLTLGTVLLGGTAPAATLAPTATTGSVTSVRPASAVVTGTVNPNGSATAWFFEYGQSTSSNYSGETRVASAGTGTQDEHLSGTLVGLAPAASYRYRIVARSSAGTTYGGDGIFNTSAAPVVLTGPATGLTTSSATLNGIVNTEALASSWYFEYGPSASYGTKTAAKYLGASPNNANVSATISNLASKTRYHFRLVATSSAGTSLGVDFVLTTGLSVTLNSSLSAVVYGSSVTLSGTVASASAGDHVTVLSQPYNQAAFAGLVVIPTGTGGTWSYVVKPSVRTSYEATANGGTSSAIVVGVAPAVSLAVLSGGRPSTKVVGAVSFASHVLQLQRLSNGLWVTWKHVRLNANAEAIFATSLPKGVTQIRMAIGPFVAGIDQAAPGYQAGFSRVIAYKK